MSAAEKMNKAQRLAVASLVAPVLRGGSEKTARRRVGKLDKDGNVVGYTTLDEVQAKVLERAKIELAVQDGVRPKEVICKYCGKVIKVKPKSAIPRQCPTGCDRSCSTPGCANQVAAATAHLNAKKGAANHCRVCTWKEHSEKVRVKMAAMTPEQRAERARNIALKAQKTKAHWRARRAKIKPPEHIVSLRRSRAARKGWETRREAGLSPEQKAFARRSVIARRVAATQSPKQRSERVRKAWKTRRAKAKAEGGVTPKKTKKKGAK